MKGLCNWLIFTLFVLEDFEGNVYEGFDDEGRKVFCCPSCSYKSAHGRADIKKHMDPKNEITVEVYESSPDCYQFKRCVSLQPEWNEQDCFKVTF